jgi:hypothetical protein
MPTTRHATRTLRKGQSVIFAASEIDVGDTVACVSDAGRQEVRVPEAGLGTTSHADAAGPNGGSTTITLETREDGSVHAKCE